MINKKTKSYESEDGSKSPQRGNDPSNSAEDQALVNLITQTAKKSSYNNSKKDLVKKPAEAPIAKPPPKRTGCCGGAGDVAKPPIQEDEERGVLKDPQSSASYDVLGMVGEGGFSKVVLVRARAGHGANGEVYAAKIIPKAHLKSAGASFVRATMLERNILGEFDHPLLLRLYHSFQEKDKLVLVVAYCPGGSLHTHVNISLKEDGRGFDEHRAAFYVAEIAQAIAHLHSHGIVHRDLKLENVLVHASGHVAVSDFGASKRLAPRPLKDCRAGNQDVPERLPDKTRVAMGLRPVQTEPPAPLLTQTKSIVGTPSYMAPEMLLV